MIARSEGDGIPVLHIDDGQTLVTDETVIGQIHAGPVGAAMADATCTFQSFGTHRFGTSRDTQYCTDSAHSADVGAVAETRSAANAGRPPARARKRWPGLVALGMVEIVTQDRVVWRLARGQPETSEAGSEFQKG
jgi:hypothetical protein